MAPISIGSTVLVTGANGFIASHIVDQLLLAGFHVRGTVRTEAKGKWEQQYFDEKYGSGKLELVVVPDMAAEGAFDDAVKGCTGVVHVASNLSLSPDPNVVIPQTIAGVTQVLEAARKETSITRFVFTSSSSAATWSVPDKEFSVDENSWNDEAVEKAWAPPPYDEPDRPWQVYGASKTQAEREVWNFVKAKKPHFAVNSILPNTNIGKIFNLQEQSASTAGFVKSLYNKEEMDDFLKAVPPQWFVHVADDARLHVAALIDPDIENERIFAFAEPWNWNTILSIMRKIAPTAKFPKDLPDNSKDVSKILPRGRAVEILRKNFGQEDFLGLEEAIRENLEGVM